MDLIIESEASVASSTDILNLTNNLDKRMSKADAENVLRSLVRDKWLSEVRYLVWFSQELACWATPFEINTPFVLCVGLFPREDVEIPQRV